MSNPQDPNFYEDDKFKYRRDKQGRIYRYKKGDYKPRPGYIRLRWLQRPYFWWKYKSFDFKNAVIPWILGFGFLFIIFQMSMYLSQRDLQIQTMAKLPEEFSKQNFLKHKKQLQIIKQQQRLKIEQQQKSAKDMLK